MTPNDNQNNGKSFREMMTELTVITAVTDSKLDTVIETLADHCARDEKRDDRLRAVEREQDTLRGRTSLLAGLNALATAIGTGFSAWFGTRS